MAVFVIDEDLPCSTAKELTKADHNALDVRDVGLRGHSDEEIFSYVKGHKAILLSADLGFANIVRFSLNLDIGIMVIRFPNEISTEKLNKELLKSLSKLKDKDIYGSFTIVEPGKVRIHRVANHTN